MVTELLNYHSGHIILAALGQIDGSPLVVQGDVCRISNHHRKWGLAFNVTLASGGILLRKDDLAISITDFDP